MGIHNHYFPSPDWRSAQTLSVYSPFDIEHLEQDEAALDASPKGQVASSKVQEDA